MLVVIKSKVDFSDGTRSGLKGPTNRLLQCVQLPALPLTSNNCL